MKSIKIFKILLSLGFSLNLAPEVFLSTIGGTTLNLEISDQEMRQARQCTLNPGEAFRRILRQKIPDALRASEYGKPAPNPLCMRLLQGLEDLEIPEEGNEEPIYGTFVIDGDICRQATAEEANPEDFNADEVKIIPGIGPLGFYQSLGGGDFKLETLLRMNLLVEELFLDPKTGFSTNPGMYTEVESCDIYQDYLPVFNQQFAEFLQATKKTVLKIFKIISENGSEQQKYDLNNIFHIMCLLYTGKDPRAPNLDRDKESAMSYDRKIEIAQEILAGLSVPLYPIRR